ncbi:MAG: hypothetical protein BV456_01445 [Thermoplasmata archaeon M8B2D]|nr:MAG: hypothetical protein BV456_01445 [Thermoplasmata archaeon M8B2D]
MKKRIGTILICILLIVSSVVIVYPINALNVNSNTLYVGGNGPGNYTRIQDAIDDASNGDTLYVFSGNYFEDLTINKSIQLIGEDKDNVIIYGSIRVKSISDVTIKSFKINHVKHLGISVDNCDFINLSEIIVYDCPEGINLYNSNHCIIENCVCYKNYGYSPIPDGGKGIIMNSNSNYNKIIGCICYNQTSLSGGYTVGIFVEGSNNEIIECKVYNSPYGILLRGNHNYVSYSYITNHSSYAIIIEGNNNEIFNNNILNNDFGIFLSSSIDNVIYKNNFIGNRFSAHFMDNSILNHWRNNYWNRPRLLPYPIFGCSRVLIINRVNFDWHPATEPYDIPIPDVP